MKKFAFNRKNRDRRGGHQNTELSDGLLHAQAGRKFAKHVFAKTARRQHRRITAEAVQEWEQDGTRLAFRDSSVSYDDAWCNTGNPNFVWFDPLNRIPEVEDREEWDDYRSEYGDMKRPEDFDTWDTYDFEYDDWGYTWEDPWEGEEDDTGIPDVLQIRLDKIEKDEAAREVLHRLGEGQFDVEQALDEIRFIFNRKGGLK